MRLRRRLLYPPAALLLLLAVCLVSLNCAGMRAMKRADDSPRRDPETGVLRGAEPVRIDRGRKGACLLLHGWITSPADFGRLPQALDAAGWDVHVPLQAGHGTTPTALKGITAEELVGTARGHYEALRKSHDRVVLVGFSIGGTIASLLAAEHLPDRLVLVAPFCGVRYRWYYVLPPRWWHAVLAPVLRSVPRAGTVYCNRREGREASITYDAFPIEASKALFRLRARLLDDTDLWMLTMPSLLVHSTGDGVCSPKAMARFFERLPAQPRRTVVFEDSNHHLLHDHDREQAIAAIVEFVGKP
jgi:carboxylesterase